MTARDDALAFLVAQCAPLYDPVAGASVTVDDVIDGVTGLPRRPRETDPTLTGTYTPPTGATSTPIRIAVTTPASTAQLHITTKPAYQGRIKGTVLLDTFSRADGYASPLTGRVTINIVESLDPGANPPFDDAVSISGTLGLADPDDYRVMMYRYTTPFHTLFAQANVDAGGAWDIGDFMGADLVDNITGQYPEFVFRVERIADGEEIGAPWSNQVDMTKRLAQTEFKVLPFLYADSYYPMNFPAVAGAEQFTSIFVRALDLSYIYGVAFTGPAAPNYHITGLVSDRDADGNLIVGGSVSDGDWQIKATYDGGLLGFFDVIGGAFELFHPDNDPTKWVFELVRVSDSAIIGGPWQQDYTDVLGQFVSDAFGFGGAAGAEWRLRLVDYATLVEVVDEEWQAASGNVEYYDNLIVRFCDVTDRAYGLTHQRASVLESFTWTHAPTRRSIRLQLATDVEDPIDGLPAPQAEWTMTSGLPRSAFYLPTDPEYGTPRLEGRVFTYDAALVLMALVFENQWLEAEACALGLVGIQFSDGSFPFAAQQRFKYAFDKWNPTGAMAFIDYALLMYKRFAPLSRQHASIDTAITKGLAWLESMRVDATGLLRGGDGRYWPAWAQSTAYALGDRRVANAQTFVVTTAGVSAAAGTGPTGAGPGIADGTVVWNRISATDFDPTYQATFHSTEHNVDAERAFRLAAIVFGKAGYLRTADVVRDQLLALHWDATKGTFFQGTDAAGVPDGSSALDCGTWAGTLAERWGERAKAVQCDSHTDDEYLVTYAGVDGYRAFSENDGVVRPDTLPYSGLWLEGSFGAMLLKKRLGDPAYAAMLADLETLQNADGSFYAIMTDDPPDLLKREVVTGGAWYLFLFHDDVFWAETTAPGVEPAIPRFLTRVEVWSDLPAAGGVMLAIARQLTNLALDLSIDSEQQMSCDIPYGSAERAATSHGCAYVLRYNDGYGSPWRVSSITDKRTTGQTNIAANHPTMDLPRLPLLRLVSSTGAISYELGFVDRTPAEYIIDAILPGCPPWIVLGAVDPTVLLTLHFSYVTPFQALEQIVEAVRQLKIPCEFQLRPIGDDVFAIDLVSAIGEAAPVVDLVQDKVMLPVTTHGDDTAQTTMVTGFGKDKSTMARAAWRCDVIDGTHVKLSDPDDGVPPILVDEQITGLYLVDPDDGTLHEILSCDALTNIAEIDDSSGFADGDLVEVRADADGTELHSLTLPGERVVFGTIEDDTLSGEYNRVPNPFGDAWSGGVNDPPDGYTLHDIDATIERVDGLAAGGFGQYAAHIINVLWDFSGSRGFESPSSSFIVANPGAVYSMAVRVQINEVHSGQYFGSPIVVPARVRLQLERLSEPDDEFFPVAQVTSDSQTVFGVPIELIVEGIVLPESGKYRVRMVEFFSGTPINIFGGPFDVVWGGFQLIEGAHASPFARGSRATRIWHLANYQLARAGEPQRQHTADVPELARVAPRAWQRLTFTLGGRVRIRGIDDLLRVVQMRQLPQASIVTAMTFVRANDSTSRQPFTALVAQSVAAAG